MSPSQNGQTTNPSTIQHHNARCSSISSGTQQQTQNQQQFAFGEPQR